MTCLAKKSLLVVAIAAAAGCQPDNEPYTSAPEAATDTAAVMASPSSVAASSSVTSPEAAREAPSSVIDLSHWKITLPLDEDGDGKVDGFSPAQLQGFVHPEFFYAQDGLVTFAAPNRATTTPNSSNTRSELHQVVNPSLSKSKAPGNNFALASNPKASEFGSIGGTLSAHLKVNHVAVEAKLPQKPPAYSVVVGQIHAGKDSALMEQGEGYGGGNEPLKIYYKKWPKHDTGSVFWTYERNLAKEDPNRTDIAYPVWGNTWENDANPMEEGIALGEDFSYKVDVQENIMHLTFSAEGRDTVEYKIDLSNNVDANGKVDEKDHPNGYTGDWFFFKAGAYNQCSVKEAKGMWYAGCAGSGDWEQDKKDGHYASVNFYDIQLDSNE
ncbi:polysaccharide lyase family 7 protein [Gilvimarinus sp. 1_MG-2023]|uniref:polysaccharide lyase family 7 protein n=1 Tax=Gilvimarinus sp. 1_MG-2023 TaxID=3062638 RepID=UPI0026E11FD9|nr:polysaccharide lyase family 7 protein [Gilvimarinus sp. 1_MG-2023]MDO6746716.1 polysaccharide lyase family 7 protein [Gilvimarinus sp. 1_MG-2023]